MIVLITKQNESFFKSLNPKLKFTSQTTNTSTFNISVKSFTKLKSEVVALGNNPYSVMTW